MHNGNRRGGLPLPVGGGMGVVVATPEAGMMEVTVTRPVVGSRRKRASVTSVF